MIMNVSLHFGISNRQGTERYISADASIQQELSSIPVPQPDDRSFSLKATSGFFFE